ncbi:MAG TPA: alpha/beta fold hydrolase [Chitinophagaceae bacterium]|nr:alpha/beta fold hydrolase [Chitinophagaceae bacterium]
MKSLLTNGIVAILASFILFSCQQKKETDKYPFLNNLDSAGKIVVGTIEVPENHNRPDEKKIKITYAILKARNSKSNNYPIIHFTGGPGGESLSDITRWIHSPLRNEHDFIIFDQRGIAYSGSIPNISPAVFQILAKNLNSQDELKQMEDSIKYYQQKCIADKINLENYTTPQNAADVGALMSKLGYEKYNLYGESYGTRLARFVMDRFPEKINSVVLDAPAILEENFLSFRITNFNDALEKIFVYCENDSNCHKNYPTLRKDYFDGIKALEQNPIEASIGGQSFFINPQDAVYLLRYQLYGPDAKTSVPAFIKAIKTRDVKSINSSQQFVTAILSSGNVSMFISTERNEEYDTLKTEKDFDELYAKLPNFPAKLAFFSSIYLASKNWHTKTMSEQEKIYKPSMIPTLIFVNKYDPVTPPKNGFVFKETLQNGKLFVLDLAGHGIGNGCEIKVIQEFVKNPAGNIDYSCLPIANNK